MRPGPLCRPRAVPAVPRLTCQGQRPVDEHGHFAVRPHACRDTWSWGLRCLGLQLSNHGRLGRWTQRAEGAAAAHRVWGGSGGGPGGSGWESLGGWALTTDDTWVPRQSCGQVDVRPSSAGQALEQDGGPVLPECAMNKHQGQVLRGLQGRQLQLRYLVWVEWAAVRLPPRQGSRLALPCVLLAPTCRE